MLLVRRNRLAVYIISAFFTPTPFSHFASSSARRVRRLDGLPAALAEVRLHRVSGIAEKRDAPVNPTGIRQDVVDVAALHILRLGALQPLDHRGAPVTEPV